jgi:hypothetical protein
MSSSSAPSQAGARTGLSQAVGLAHSVRQIWSGSSSLVLNPKELPNRLSPFSPLFTAQFGKMNRYSSFLTHNGN